MPEFITENLIAFIVGAALALAILFWLFKQFKRRLVLRRAVSKSARIRKKKMNGEALVEKIKTKRKKKTNSYSKLRRKAKRWVNSYIEYKIAEIDQHVKHITSKGLKGSKRSAVIEVVKNDKSVYSLKKNHQAKHYIGLTNKFSCLDELIIYLHFLPEAILEEQDYRLDIYHQDIALNYYIK